MWGKYTKIKTYMEAIYSLPHLGIYIFKQDGVEVLNRKRVLQQLYHVFVFHCGYYDAEIVESCCFPTIEITV